MSISDAAIKNMIKNSIEIIMLSIVSLSACTSNITFSPSELPLAYLNQPYQTSINIKGSTVIERSFKSEVSSPDFIVTNTVIEDGEKDYNNLIIRGTPNKLEPVYITISGATYGTNFPGEEFEKKYFIEVRKTPK